MIARIALGDREIAVDLARPIDLSIAVRFDVSGPRYFGALPARSLDRTHDEAQDGAHLLALHVTALAGDAVPSRPLLYRWLA